MSVKVKHLPIIISQLHSFFPFFVEYHIPGLETSQSTKKNPDDNTRGVQFRCWEEITQKKSNINDVFIAHMSRILPWRRNITSQWCSVSLHCTLHCHGIIYAHSKTKFTRMSARLEKFVSIQHSKLRLNL